MTSLLYCLEGAHRKGFAGAIYSPSDIQTEVLTHAAVSTVKERKTEIKKQKVQKQRRKRTTVSLPRCPSLLYLLTLRSRRPLMAAAVPLGQTL